MSTPTEIMNSHFNLKFDASTQSFWIQDALGHKLTFSSPVLSQQELADRVRPIWEHTKKHPAAMALLQKSLGNGSISVVFKAQEDLRTAAHWYNAKREIGMLGTVTDLHTLLEMFIFELNNSINKKMHEVRVMDCKDAEEYALKAETAEYETSERTAQIMIDGLNQYDWPATNENVAHRAHRTLEEYLSDVRRGRFSHSGISHFDGYKLEYYSLKICMLDATIVGQSLIRATAQETLAYLSTNKNLAKNEDIQKFTAIYEELNAKVEVAQKEKMELMQQKEEIENDAKNWKIREDSEGKLFEEVQKNSEQYNLEIKKQHAYLSKIRALPQYAHDLLLQASVNDVYSAHIKMVNLSIHTDCSLNAWKEESICLLQNFKEQNKKLVDILHKTDRDDPQPVTFMKTRESAIYQQKSTPEDKGQNDRLNYKKYGYGFGSPGVVEAP